ATVLVEEGAPVAGHLTELVGLEELDDRGADQQRCEHHEHDDREATDGCVHRSPPAAAPAPTGAGSVTRSPTGRRAWSLIRRRSATMIQCAISEDPPEDRNGVVRPVSGMTRVRPPTTTKTCRPIEKARPTASSLPKPSREPIAVLSPRSTRSA